MELKLGYKQTEVGVIPEDWDAVPLGKLYKFSNGVNADKAAYGKGLRFINVLEPITYSHIRGPEITGLVELTSQVASAYTVNHGDIVFNRTSETDTELGMAAAYLGHEKVVFGGFVIRGQAISDDLDPTYAGYALRGEMVRDQTIPLGQGAVRANIGQESLRKVRVLVPPEHEQKLIAEALQDIDSLLTNIQESLYKKRQIKQAAMQELLTGKRRLPGFEREWEVKRLGDICTKIQDGTHFSPALGGNDYLYITSKNIREGFMDLENVQRISAAEHEKIYRRCDARKGDLLLTKDGANTGNAAIVEIDEEFSLLSSVAMLRFDEQRHKAAYFMYQLLSAGGQSQVQEAMSGNAITRLTLAKIRDLRFNAPEVSEQIAISVMLLAIDQEISVATSKLKKASLLKQGMMQQLLTGKIRLK